MTTPIPYTSITAAHWQPALGTSGEVVEGLRDIDQAIRIILPPPRAVMHTGQSSAATSIFTSTGLSIA